MNDIYLSYNLEDFLADDQFVDWVLSGKEDQSWNTWLSSHPDVISRIEEAKKLIRHMKFKEEAISTSSKRNLWDRINKDTQAKEIRLPARRRWLSALAAAASIALIGFIWLNNSTETYSTDIAEYRDVTLPAQSLIQIGPSSKITYDDQDWNENRHVNLDGQAHFSVSKGVPFTVETEFGQVQVLGTEFDVLAEQGAFLVKVDVVKVDEGKVKVNSGRHEHILTAGMSFYRNPIRVNQDFQNKWETKNMIIAFEEQPLEDVLNTLSLVTDKQIDIQSVDTRQLYTGKYDSKEPLDDILQQVLWPLQITYTIEGNTIKLN